MTRDNRSSSLKPLPEVDQVPAMSGPASTNLKNTGRTRELLDVAIKLFYEKGFDRTSIKDIADELGILKGSIYHHIRSKDDLLFAVIELVHQSMEQNVATVEALANSGNAATTVEQIRAFIEGHVDLCLTNLHASRVYAADLGALPTERHDMILAKRTDYERFFRKLLTDGQEAGSVRADLTARVLAPTILSGLNSVHRWYEPGRSLSHDEVRTAYVTAALGGLGLPIAPAQSGHPRIGRPA
jgi:AcrR family transcriptional regulator